MTRIQTKKSTGATRPVKQNYHKSGKLAARREVRRKEAEIRNEASTPELREVRRRAYHIARNTEVA